MRETVSSVPVAAPGRPWALWVRQALAIVRLELRKAFLGRRVIGLLVLALMPVFILTVRALIPESVDDPANLGHATQEFSWIFQGFILRIVVFLGCVSIFGNLIRKEVLERSLHYYFLSPVRRELLVVAKYLTGLVVALVLFEGATLASFLLSYAPHTGVEAFLLRGPGLGHLASYMLITALGCAGYGAVFLAFGFFFRSPAIPALAVFGWEGIHFLLPPLLKKVSVIHYLQSLSPVPIEEGPLAILADAPSPWIAVPGVLVVSAVLLALAALKIRTMEVKYEDE